MQRVAVISAIIEDPRCSQEAFNHIISEFQDMIRGRLGIPMPEQELGVVALVVVGSTDQINQLTGRLGRLEHVTVKTAMTKKELD
ncbi:iron-only hydrogenase system regulator [Oscillospiraceae bacterium HV4-5-C5C]|nr:iron-only hydrogenase system regulator [Oscillospiraceae bacterium HV4-5-C5C]